ncbi:hypothetical protein Tco_0392944 [Tanacetum coccineum]
MMVKDQVFTVNLHHDGIFIASPLRYVQGDLKQITDIDFEGMSFDVFRDIIKHLVHGIVYRFYYCPIRTPLNVGIKELKTDSDVQDFIRVEYENKWFVELYVKHFDYDVMDFINEEANRVLSGGSSDEYYSSDEIEEFDDVDFHTKGEKNVVIKNLTTHDPFLNKLCGNMGMFRDYLDESVPKTEGEALDDPDDAHINPIHKAQKGVTYPKHDPIIPWNKMTLGSESSKSTKSAPKSSKKDAKSTKTAGKSAKSAGKSTKSTGKSVKSGRGELLTAMGRDANNQMYPIAWVVVKGLLDVVGDWLPNAEHRKCTRHVYANFKKKYNGLQLQRLFWGATSSTVEELFYAKMDDLKYINLEAYKH